MSTAFTRRRESREIQTNKNKTQKGLLANIEAPFMLMKGGKVILIGQTHWSYLLRSRSGCWSAAGNRRHGTCRLRDGDLHLLRIWRGIWRQARKWERNRERKRYGSGGEVKKKKKKRQSQNMLVATVKTKNYFQILTIHTQNVNTPSNALRSLFTFCVCLSHLTIKQQTNIRC